MTPTTTLHDRLADLATAAPEGPPDLDLWTRGQRYQRTRRAGTVVIAAAAAVVVAVVLGVTWQRSVPAPAPAGAPAGLPDRVWTPSRWLPGTDDAGDLGQLAAVLPAVRGTWTGSTSGLVGVSATTGEYRFLDLPGWPDLGQSLAPDGRHVAYWVTGDPSGSPNDDRPIVGFAVYDTTTGGVERHEIATVHGLATETLGWADDDRLVLAYGQYHGGVDDDPMDQGLVTDSSLRTWTLGDADTERVDLGEDAGLTTSVVGEDRVLVSDGQRYTVVDLDDPRQRTTVRVRASEHLGNAPVVDMTGTRVAGIWGGPDPSSVRIPNRVKAGAAGADGGPAPLSLVPDSARTLRILAWVDDSQLAVLRSPGQDGSTTSLERLDVHTGARVPLTTYDDTEPVFAGDLLTAPTIHAEEPPQPLDPRVVSGLVAGTTVVALGGLVLWRRRVRA